MLTNKITPILPLHTSPMKSQNWDYISETKDTIQKSGKSFKKGVVQLTQPMSTNWNRCKNKLRNIHRFRSEGINFDYTKTKHDHNFSISNIINSLEKDIRMNLEDTKIFPR